MIGFIGTSLLLQSIITVHNQWQPKTCSIPYWTTRVFSSAVTDLVLIYESVTYKSLRTNDERRITCEWTLESESHVTTDGRSASLSWNEAPIWSLQPDFYYCQTVATLLMWGARSDERTGLSFKIAAGARQRSHSRVQVPWGLRLYFIVSD
jgi:hypothetical protein